MKTVSAIKEKAFCQIDVTTISVRALTFFHISKERKNISFHVPRSEKIFSVAFGLWPPPTQQPLAKIICQMVFDLFGQLSVFRYQ